MNDEAKKILATPYQCVIKAGEPKNTCIIGQSGAGKGLSMIETVSKLLRHDSSLPLGKKPDASKE
ncbi:MAG TPA: hypothetical protein VIE65_13000 [Methylobacter sp.]|jgi:hypothetical protein